jgi:hypothetical protein
MSDERGDLGERASDEAIRSWLAHAPERAPERALNETIERLRETDQPRLVELRLPLPLAAAVALLVVVLIGGLALRAGLGPLPAANPTPTPAPSGSQCVLEQPVSGRHTFVVGRGFAPDSDVVLEIDRANGSHITLTPAGIASLHTDRNGSFGVELIPYSEDLGTGRMTAIAGCSASLEFTVTAEQIGPPCVDPGLPQSLMDGVAYRAAVESDAPLHWWHLDEQTGPVAGDATGDAGGTWQGALSGVAGDGGTGALFLPGDGGSYVALPEILVDEFTVEAWVLLCDYADNADALVGNGSQSPDMNFFEARLRLFVAEEGDVVAAGSAAQIGAWEHWALTRDALGITRVYHNGILDATGAIWEGQMRVTEIGRGDAGSLRGAIDELAIYDRALTEEELTGHALAR